MDYERPEVSTQCAFEGGGTATVDEYVPFTPDFYWTLHPPAAIR